MWGRKLDVYVCGPLMQFRWVCYICDKLMTLLWFLKFYDISWVLQVSICQLMILVVIFGLSDLLITDVLSTICRWAFVALADLGDGCVAVVRMVAVAGPVWLLYFLSCTFDIIVYLAGTLIWLCMYAPMYAMLDVCECLLLSYYTCHCCRLFNFGARLTHLQQGYKPQSPETRRGVMIGTRYIFGCSCLCV